MQERGTQNFQGSVDKVAGRDVNIFGICPQAGNEEWEIQKAFDKATGICCNKKAREWLTFLMVQHGFTARELGNAWRFKTIAWDQEKETHKLSTGWFDLVCAYGLFAVATIYFAAIAAVFLFGPGSEYKYSLQLIQCTAGMYLFMCWCIRKIFLLPRSVSLRVKGVMEQLSQRACLT